MKIADILLTIGQELVPFGKYAPGQLQSTEIKLTLDTVVNNIFNEVVKQKAVEVSGYTAELLSSLKVSTKSKAFNIDDDKIVIEKPELSEVILSSNVVKYSLEDYNNDELIINEIYKPVEQAKINGTWTTEITKATESTFLGKVQRVKYESVPIRIVESEKKRVYASLPFYKSNPKSLLGELVGNTIIVDLVGCGDISYINLVYYRQPFKFSSLNDLDECPYKTLVVTELINETIKKLKI